jgi:hypothetical protein
LTCSGIVNPHTLSIVLTVSFTPPSPIGNYTGVSLWLLIPAAPGADAVQTVSGSTTVASNTTVANGLPNPIFIQSFENPTLPLTVTTLFPLVNGLNPQMATPCTLYCTSNSAVNNPPVSMTTPSVNFTLEPSTGTNPTAATNVTTDIVQELIVTEVGSQTVSGKMITGLLAIVTGIPDTLPTGWNYILVGVQGTNDPTVAANQQKLTGPETVEGPVPAPPSGDGFTLGQTSFVMQTPSASTAWTIYAVAGIATNYNSIVPGITCSCPLTLDSGSSGVLSAIDVLQSTISSELSTATGKLGITPSSLTSSFLAPGSAVGNLASSSIVASLLATGVAETNLGIVSAAAIISPSTITGTLISGNTITGSLLATSGIITTSAQIGTAVIAAASIISLGVSQLTAGSAQFSGTATFQYGSSGPFVAIASAGVEIEYSSTVYAEWTSSGLLFVNGSYELTMSSSQIQMTNGTYALTLGSSQIELSNGTQELILSASGINLYANSSNYISVTTSQLEYVAGGSAVFTVTSSGSGTVTCAVGTFSSSVSTGTLGCTTVNTTDLTVATGLVVGTSGSPSSTTIEIYSTITTSASGNGTGQFPVGFFPIKVQGGNYLLPFYNT